MMTSLSVTRKLDQTIELLIGGLHLAADARAIVTITRCGKRDVRVNIKAPEEVPILRGELTEQSKAMRPA